MGKSVYIAEKPSVAKSIASALGASSRADGFYEGNGLLVSWCVGHLVSPMDAGGYDEHFKKWRYDDLPILPEPFRYVLAPGKEDAFENLRALMDRHDEDTIVNACEAHLHIPMADFVVYVVVAAPVKPDLIGQPVFHFLFEVDLFQPLPALFLQAQAVTKVVQKLLNYICRPFLFHGLHPLTNSL